MNRDEIQEFFLLKDNSQLFDDAVCPPSCGGGEKFKLFALYGDLVIDMHLYRYFENNGLERSQDITSRRGEIHNSGVIKAFANEFLGIQQILTPSDANHQLQDRELAETVEALLGAAYETSGLDSCKPMVESLIEFAIERQKKLWEEGEFDESKNYIGELNELFQKNGLSNPKIEPKPEEGSCGFRFEGIILFKDKKIQITTRLWLQKDKVIKEAAYFALCSINGNNPKYRVDPITLQISKEQKVQPTTSLDSDKLIFLKNNLNKTMAVSYDTNELLVDWLKRKIDKDPMSALILLNARLDSVSGASWTCEDSPDVLAIINLQLNEKKYFAIGVGESKTKARKAAAEKMLKEVDLNEWVDKYYPNYII